MDFEYRKILVVIPIILLILIPLFVLKHRDNQTKLKEFIGNNIFLVPSTNKIVFIIRYSLLLLSIILILFSIARPIHGYLWQESTTTGLDIVIALDTSKSMDAIDVKPNRLIQSKMALLELLSSLNGDRVALIPFAGSAFVMTPFTADYDIVRESINSIDTNIIPNSGTNIRDAIIEAKSLFKNSNKYKIIILITDGEDLAKQGLDEAKKISEEGIQIFTIGVGTEEGELIPDQENPGQYLKDKKGSLVKSKLDTAALNEISRITGGEYLHLSNSKNALLQIYNQKLIELEEERKTEQKSRIPIDKYRWFLLPAVILLLMEFLLGNRRKKINKKSLFTLLFLLLSNNIFATNADNLLIKKDYQKAIELYSNEKKSPESLFNFGTAYYLNKNYDNAIETYNEGLKISTPKLQEKILFNLGNSYYRKSENIQDINSKIDTLKKSLESYEGSIQLGNSDDKVVKNRDFIKKKLEELEQQQQDQQQQDQQQQDQQQQDQQQQDQQQQDQ
ncbi:MAG: VWA domain-containing protein, partial [Spirochaetales bacterium]|nr:VWA domain-containing protein [Spirochaetales bacterium]